jgi:hypothetical protein
MVIFASLAGTEASESNFPHTITICRESIYLDRFPSFPPFNPAPGPFRSLAPDTTFARVWNFDVKHIHFDIDDILESYFGNFGPFPPFHDSREFFPQTSIFFARFTFESLRSIRSLTSRHSSCSSSQSLMDPFWPSKSPCDRFHRVKRDIELGR